MEDICVPANTSFNTQRIYTLLIPSLLIIVFFELCFIMFNYPDSLGSVFSVKGSLPVVPSSLTK
jgi:hypothetical protein